MLQSVVGGILGGSDDEAEAGAGGSESDEEMLGDDDEEEAAAEEAEAEEEGQGDIFGKKGLAKTAGEQRRAVERLSGKAAGIKGRAKKAAAGAGGEEGGDAAPSAPVGTVFVRGLALDTSRDQLFTKLKVRPLGQEGEREGALVVFGIQRIQLLRLPATCVPACDRSSHPPPLPSPPAPSPPPPQAFGPVKSCRLVMDKASERPKGTAFVDFYDQAAAQRAAEACARGRRQEGPGVVVGGRVVEVDMALDQDGARSLAATKAGTGPGAEPGDKRNMYLVRAGAGGRCWRRVGPASGVVAPPRVEWVRVLGHGI